MQLFLHKLTIHIFPLGVPETKFILLNKIQQNGPELNIPVLISGEKLGTFPLLLSLVLSENFLKQIVEKISVTVL